MDTSLVNASSNASSTLICDTDVEKYRARALKCDAFARRCRERAKELLAQANSFDVEASQSRVEANRLEALQLREAFTGIAGAC